MALVDRYTAKQIEVLKAYKRNDWRFMINYGAVRAGKTRVDNDLFMMELKRVRKMADADNVPEPMYILAGVSSKTIQNNVLQDLTNEYGIDFHFDRNGSFNLFGVKVVMAYTGSIAGLGAIRGMTSYGAYINEASLANEAVFEEIKNRCSIDGSRIILDTNPDNPEHWLKKNYIDNKDKDAKIVSFHFTMDDNTFLSEDYIKTQKASKPAGMFYDRDILGLWVSGDGMVYSEFNKETMTIAPNQVPEDVSYFVGVDWGYGAGHYGVVLVFAQDKAGNIYLVEEHAHEYREVAEYWLPLAKRLADKYGSRLPFYCDTARPEYIKLFSRHGLNVRKTNKTKLPGIECVASLMKQGRFFVACNAPVWMSQVYNYTWDERTGEPVKKNDDTMDAMRYAIYNHSKATGTRILMQKGGL